MNEQMLWMFFKAGSAEAFSSMYQKYGPHLFKYGKKLTSNKKMIEDSIHDLFIELWDKRDHLGEVVSVKYYLCKCLYRKILKSASQKTWLRLDEKNHCDPVPSIEDSILQQEEKILQKISFYQKMNGLSKKEREAIYLKYYKDLSTEKIASTLSLSMKSTYNLLSRGIVSLRQTLRSHSEQAKGLYDNETLQLDCNPDQNSTHN